MEVYRKVLLIAVIGFIATAAVFTVYLTYQKMRTQKLIRSPSINRKKNNLYFFFWVFSNTPLLKIAFKKVLIDTETIYPSDRMSINQEATKTMLKSSLIVAVMIIYTLFMAKGDLWFLGMGIVCSICFFHMLVTRSFKAKQAKLLDQMKVLISHIKHHYQNRAIVEDALYDCIGEVPREIELHVEKIYKIITSPTMEAEIEDYVNSSPNSLMLMLLMICATCKKYSNGERAFIDNLNFLEEEINAEKLKTMAIKNKFNLCGPMCLSTIFFIKPAQIWVSKNMSDAAGFYNSMAGEMTLIGIFALVFICYFLVEILSNIERGKIKQDDIFKKIAGISQISRIVNRYINKNFIKTMNLDSDMKLIGDHTTPKSFYVKQVCFAIVAFLLVFTGTISGIVVEKNYLVSNFSASFDSSVIPNEKYRAAMAEEAEMIAKYLKHTSVKKIDRDELAAQVIERGTVKQNVYAYLMADQILAQLQEYQAVYYKWWMLLMAFSGAGFGFFLPTWILKFQKFLAKNNKKEEVNQFRTLILIFMASDGISLEVILEWMERFSYSFKPTISECLVNLPMGQKKVLEKMKFQEETSKEFIRFVECLEEMLDTDINLAFSDIVTERTYSLKEREMETNKMIDSRGRIAALLSLVPASVLLVGYLMAPMFSLSTKMLNEFDFSTDINSIM